MSSRQTTRGQPTPQRRREEGLLDGGNGWGRRVAERLWLLEIMTKIISWKILESGTCSEICYSNPVESCPPFVRRPQRAVAAWFDNATVDGADPSGSCYTTVLTVQQIILTLNSLVDAKQPVNVRVSRWTFPASGCRSEYLTRRTFPALLISGNA